MVEISGKPDTLRIACAEGKIKLRKETIKRIREGKIEKGDPLTIAQLAGIMAAKKTPEIVPLCHPISITGVKIEFQISNEEIIVKSEVKAVAKTGVEMEALTATLVALLTIWDVVKAYEKDEAGQYPDTKITEIKVASKIKREIEEEK